MKSLGDTKQNQRRGLVVDDHMRVAGAEDSIYAMGDCTATAYAPTAQVASQQGKYLARVFETMAKREQLEAGLDLAKKEGKKEDVACVLYQSLMPWLVLTPTSELWRKPSNVRRSTNSTILTRARSPTSCVSFGTPSEECRLTLCVVGRARTRRSQVGRRPLYAWVCSPLTFPIR